MACREADLRYPEAPRSVQRVYCCLLQADPVTMKGLRERSGLARRTVYAAVQQLRADGVLRAQVNLKDTRQMLYWIDEAA